MKKSSVKQQEQSANPAKDRKLSLNPLSFDEAIADLLKVAPQRLETGPQEGKASTKGGPQAKRPTKTVGHKTKR